MKLSVVMSCYNSEKYLASAIDSILNQTFTDFEFIIWNDGSTDRTEEIIKSYDDSRIRYFYHENTGLGQALRLACQEVKSPIIARMDADDIALPNRLQIEYDYLQSHPDVVLVSSAVNFIDDDNNFQGRSFPYTKDVILRRLLIRWHNAIVHPASMFRKEAYDRAGGYNALRRAQDKLLFARIMKFGAIANLPHALLNYRIAQDSISTSADSSGYVPVIKAMMDKMIMDEVVLDDDISLYNTVIAYSKKYSNKVNGKEIINRRIKRNKHIFHHMYNMVEPVFGKAISEALVIVLKNIAGYIKTCRWKVV